MVIGPPSTLLAVGVRFGKAILQMAPHKRFGPRPDLLLGDVPQTLRSRKAAIIGAGPIRTGLAFDPLGCRVEGNKPFGQLRAEDRQGRHAAEGRQMSAAGIVADKGAGPVHEGKNFADVARRDYVRFTRSEPPSLLVGIASDLHAKV